MTQSVMPIGARSFAISLAKDAGALLREKLRQARTIDFKGTVDLVTDADRASEALISARLRAAYPEHGLFGEEGARASASAGDSPYCWIFDPLDGTTNYAHGYPHFAVSIALECDGDAILGVVYDPMRDELFAADKGNGATVNGETIEVSENDALLRSLVFSGLSYDRADLDEQLPMWGAFARAAQGMRRDGAAALNLSHLAAGRIDGYYERPLEPWDMAAGGLIVREAGGTLTAMNGGQFNPHDRQVVASNGRIHAEMLELIAEHDRTR